MLNVQLCQTYLKKKRKVMNSFIFLSIRDRRAMEWMFPGGKTNLVVFGLIKHNRVVLPPQHFPYVQFPAVLMLHREQKQFVKAQPPFFLQTLF